MDTNYTIKNFRVFDKDGVNVEIKPITILTGCNSSGKSSIAKSLILLTDYMSSFNNDLKDHKDIDLCAHKLDFTKKPNNLLGKFSKVINRNSSEKTIAYEFTTHSRVLGEDVSVEISFASDEKDFELNGHFNSIDVKKLDGTSILAINNDKLTGNLYSVFEEFLRFVITQSLLYSFQQQTFNYKLGSAEWTMPQSRLDLLNDTEQKTKEFLCQLEQIYGKEVGLDIFHWMQDHPETPALAELAGENWYELLDNVKSSRVLYYLPVLSLFDGKSKDESIKILKDEIETNDDEGIKHILMKVVDDFSNSSHESFMSYYNEWGINYLTNFTWSLKNSSRSCVLRGDDFCWSVDHIGGSPCHGLDKEALMVQNAISEWKNTPLDFSIIFELLAIMSTSHGQKDNCYYTQDYAGTDDMFTSSTIQKMYFRFIEYAFNDILETAFNSSVYYSSSSIVNTKRLYALDSDDELTQLLNRYLDVVRNQAQNDEYIPYTFINKWIKRFGIGERIEIKVDDEGLGATLRLFRREDDENGELLADTGYGITQLFSCLLMIEIAIIERKKIKKLDDFKNLDFSWNLSDHEVFTPNTIAIEEPEIHLHPRMQSLLADMFVEAYKDYNIHFIVETHSEYLIRKMQVLVARKECDLDSISLNYVNDSNPKNRLVGEPQVKQIGIAEDGRLTDAFGSGFFDEADNIVDELFNIKMQRGNA